MGGREAAGMGGKVSLAGAGGRWLAWGKRGQGSAVQGLRLEGVEG